MPPVLRRHAQPHDPAGDIWHRCPGKWKLTHADWPLPYGAGGHLWNVLWKTPTCPGEVISRCTSVWIATCCFNMFLQVIDFVFMFSHPEKLLQTFSYVFDPYCKDRTGFVHIYVYMFLSH